jgi:hypothetical protein
MLARPMWTREFTVVSLREASLETDVIESGDADVMRAPALPTGPAGRGGRPRQDQIIATLPLIFIEEMAQICHLLDDRLTLGDCDRAALPSRMVSPFSRFLPRHKRAVT